VRSAFLCAQCLPGAVSFFCFCGLNVWSVLFVYIFLFLNIWSVLYLFLFLRFNVWSVISLFLFLQVSVWSVPFLFLLLCAICLAGDISFFCFFVSRCFWFWKSRNSVGPLRCCKQRHLTSPTNIGIKVRKPFFEISKRLEKKSHLQPWTLDLGLPQKNSQTRWMFVPLKVIQNWLIKSSYKDV
jgi:hypothetical protein